MKHIIRLRVIVYGILKLYSNVTNALLSTSCDTPVEDNTSISPNTFVLCHDDVICLSFETTVEGNLTITDGTDTTDTICEAVKTDPAIRNMSNKTYVLGGENRNTLVNKILIIYFEYH